MLVRVPLTPPSAPGRSPSRRLFLALDLPAAARGLLAGCTEALPGARWVPAEQLHLTLRFLGKVEEAAVDGLRAVLAAVRAPPFELGLTGLGLFPPAVAGGRAAAPRVLWAGVSPAGPVQALKRAIDARLGPDPEAAGRAFSPHVTLARFKAPHDQDLPTQLAEYLARRGGLGSDLFPVRAFRLYESRTLPGGPEYAALADFPLVAP
jgi:RNA 2',3'-cyclic 3'-phosphodiesterase